MRHKSLNESILSVTNPQPKLVEEQRYIEEYIAMLESALEAIAEELECDVEDLLEDIQTPARAAQSTRKINKAWLHANTSESNKEENKRNRKYYKIFNKREKESKSKKTYGMGGKIVKKATVKEEQTAQLSPEQRAAAMKDRNSSIHRTPAELKKFAASRKAYVKSQNNMTDSKGKKLDPYDDYQS